LSPSDSVISSRPSLFFVTPISSLNHHPLETPRGPAYCREHPASDSINYYNRLLDIGYSFSLIGYTMYLISLALEYGAPLLYVPIYRNS
jgi:hypothetical protein